MGLIKSKCEYCGVTDTEPKRKVQGKKFHIKYDHNNLGGESCEGRAKNIVRKHGKLD